MTTLVSYVFTEGNKVFYMIYIAIDINTKVDPYNQ